MISDDLMSDDLLMIIGMQGQTEVSNGSSACLPSFVNTALLYVVIAYYVASRGMKFLHVSVPAL